MKLQHLRNLTNLFLIGLLVLVLAKCKYQKGLQVSEVFIGIKINNHNYEYAEDAVFKLNGMDYSLRQKAVYGSDGTIDLLINYKPEGRLEYTREVLLKDKNILAAAGFPIKQNWIYEGNKLKNGTKEMRVQKITGKYLQSEANGMILFYKLR